MDYEKKYKEALERARALRNEAIEEEYAVDYINDYETIFPELRESEEERIRKELINFILYRAGRVLLDKETEHRFVAYLEKQKESPMPNSTELIEMWDAEREMLKEKDLRGDTWRIAQNAFMDGFARGTCVKFEKQKEQKPANNYLEWRNIVYYVLKEWLGIGQYMDMAPFNDIVKTLQERYSLPKSAEWSEEDDQLIGFIFDLLNSLVWRKEWAMDKKECLERLNSFRSRPKSSDNWKPSKMQMKALEKAIIKVHSDDEIPILTELRQQLKKLM